MSLFFYNFWIKSALSLLLSALIAFSQEPRPTFSLTSLDSFESLSSQLQLAYEQTRHATVCIDLDEGSSGSGVLVSPKGLIMSAAHVTQEAGKSFTVILENGLSYPALGLGMDTSHDASFAQLQLPENAPALPFVTLSSDSHIGEFVFSLGHAGGADPERGGVIRLGRILELDDFHLKTDCTLIGGDSGGPLFNLHGDLIAIHSRVGTITSSNTHIPVKVFQDQWEALSSGSVVGDGSFANAPFLFYDFFLLEQNQQLKVSSPPKEDSPSYQKLKKGDRLLKLNTSTITTKDSLLETLTTLDPVATITLTLQRDSEQFVVTLLPPTDNDDE